MADNQNTQMSINDENQSLAYPLTAKRRQSSLVLNPISKFQSKSIIDSRFDSRGFIPIDDTTRSFVPIGTATNPTINTVTNPTGFEPIDTIIPRDMTSIFQNQSRDSDDIYYEASPVHYDEIQSFKAMRYGPSLIEPLKEVVEVVKEPRMVLLAPDGYPLDFTKVLSDQVHYAAPFCRIPEPACDQHDEETDNLRVLGILQYEIEDNDKPKFSFKKFFNWLSEEEYHEQYPWSKYVRRNLDDPLSIEQIQKLIPGIDQEFF